MAEADSVTVGSFTAGDGYCWKYRRYRPAGPPAGRIVCLHGIQSHGGWYGHSCSRLAQRGYLVDFLDRRGSGLNEAARGDAPSFRRLLDDIAEFLRSSGSLPPCGGGSGWGEAVPPASSNPPPQPSPSPLPLSRRGRGVGVRGEGEKSSVLHTFLLAVSWGGKLAVALQRRHPGLVAGLALLCPGFFPQVGPPLKERLAIAWSRLVAPGRLFPIPLNDPELFTATLHWQQFIRDDPLALRQASARLLIESVRLDGYLRGAPRHVRVPTLLMLAEHDRIIRNVPTRRYVERFATADRQIIEYPGAHHTLEFEPDPDQFLADLERWLDRQRL